MRVVATATLLFALAFAGCIGGGFDETQTTDAFGNTYDVFASDGDVPEDGATVEGATARDLLTKADAMAADWSDQANLFTVSAFELSKTDATAEIFAGPMPAGYELYDASVGDGLAPYWDYLYVSPEKVADGSCEYLFVHVAYNGFVVGYLFDPREADFGGDDRASMWLCDEHAPVHAHAEWTIDSDEAASTLDAAGVGFSDAIGDAEAVLWGLSPAAGEDPEDSTSFKTQWLAFAMPELGIDADPTGIVTCFTAASDAPAETACAGVDRGDGGDEDPEVPEPLAIENGTGTAPFGFAFSGAQDSTFDIEETGHPLLTVDYTIAADEVYSSVTIDLVGPNGTVVDTATEQFDGSQKAGSLTATDPEAGEWKVEVDGSSGTPQVDFTWCADGYDYANETAIACA